MRTYTAFIREIQLQGKSTVFWLECPTTAAPMPGQYTLANNIGDEDAPLATPLFPVRYGEGSFMAAPLDIVSKPPAYSTAWLPGMELRLRGPVGRGFTMPGTLRKLALADMGGGALRLMPMVSAGLERGADVALFSDAPPAMLPSRVEINPLHSLGEALNWADYLAVDVALEQVENLAELLGLPVGHYLPCPGEALVTAAMPCGGAAGCGACAVKVRRRWKLVCTDGPVFNLRDLLSRG